MRAVPGVRGMRAYLPGRRHPFDSQRKAGDHTDGRNPPSGLDGDRAGKLQNLIFDNQVLFSHRALAAVLGVILKLPPVKQIMASEQMRSVYLERLISWYNAR